jgi:hypothetical protein
MALGVLRLGLWVLGRGFRPPPSIVDEWHEDVAWQHRVEEVGGPTCQL